MNVMMNDWMIWYEWIVDELIYNEMNDMNDIYK